MITRHVITAEEAQRVADLIVGLPRPLTITWKEGGKRSLSANALLHRWYGEIAKHYGDRTAAQVKGECHMTWGVPIKMRDPAWAWVWRQVSERLTYEQKCRVFERGILAVTSTMTTKEMTEYMDALSQHYRVEGVYLTDPELAKWENDE